MLYGALIRLSGGLPPDLRENSNDLAIYRETGEALVRGDLPYRDFFLEYPPGSLPAFIPPAILSDDRQAFVSLFSSEMALFLVASLVLVAVAARRLHGPRAWPAPALTFASGAVLLYPVAVTRYDAVVALALAFAVFAATSAGRYVVLAYAAVGIAAAAKLVPALAAAPLILARRMAAAGTGVLLAVLAASFVPALALGGDDFVASFAYHAERGLQVESVASSVLMALGLVDGVVFEFGAFEALGAGASWSAAISPALTGGLVLVTGLAVYLRPGGQDFPRPAAALILAFMLGSKVLSPQYVIWLLPLVPLCARGRAGALVGLVFLAACLSTTLVFPLYYGELLDLRSPGPELLLLRNILLVALWVLLLLLPANAASRRGPA